MGKEKPKATKQSAKQTVKPSTVKPGIVEAVGASASASRQSNVNLAELLEAAMSQAVMDARAVRIKDPAEIKERMLKARDEAKAQYYAKMDEAKVQQYTKTGKN
jgi:hypothetical protein